MISGPPSGQYWRTSEETLWKWDAQGRVWWGEDGNNAPAPKIYLSEVMSGRVPQTLWFFRDVGHTDESKKEVKQIVGFQTREEGTITPKPVRLLRRILEIGTDKHSIVLDSFAGSGTTAQAVLGLNKKDGGNRKFILVEMEDYADTLTAERLRRVIQGYAFEGTQREELLRETLTWTKLKKAAALVQKADSIEQFEGSGFDKVTKTVEDGALVVTGEKIVPEKTEGLGGNFTYATLGQEMSLDKLLADGLPTFEALAKYVFYTATGQTLTDVPKPEAGTVGLIGETDIYRVHLHYKRDKAWLQSNDAALTEQLLDAMIATKTDKKRLLIFAPAKFMSQRELTRLGVEFCQLPFAIHRMLGD